MNTNPHQEALIAMDNAGREAGHAPTTREQYAQWVVRYRNERLLKSCHNLQSYLTRLSTVEKVNPKTVRQALNALKFYHEKVLGIDILPNSLTVPPINRNENVPVWLTHEEAIDLIGRMDGVARLQAELLYGTGSRIKALLTLRLKDLDLQKGLVVFRYDKGGKSRTVQLPRSVMPRLTAHIANVRLRWESDRKRGIVFPCDDQSLMKKLGRNRYGSLPFCWLFPSRDVRGDERWHATDKALVDATRKAADEAGIMKRVSPHSFRHSNATSLCERGENPRNIQKHLGHTHLQTTEIYLHACGRDTVVSPLDLPPIQRIDFPSISQFSKTA
jgi:site-specific recombinase XerD